MIYRELASPVRIKMRTTRAIYAKGKAYVNSLRCSHLIHETVLMKENKKHNIMQMHLMQFLAKYVSWIKREHSTTRQR